jgi:hypothetical protein
MIEFSRSYKASDGKCYASLEEAQAVELADALDLATPDGLAIAKAIVENKDAILNILTLTDASRPKARGQKKPRKPKAPPVDQPELVPAAQTA